MNALNAVTNELHKHWIEHVSKDPVLGCAVVECTCGDTIQVSWDLMEPDPSREFTIHCATKLIASPELDIRIK